MRNLRNVRLQHDKVPTQYHGRPLTAVTWDLADSEDTLICTFGPTLEDVLIELVRVKTSDSSL